MYDKVYGAMVKAGVAEKEPMWGNWTKGNSPIETF
jgi:hypothetical protein